MTFRASRIALEPAWILHMRPWRDTSALLEVVSRDYGRVGLIARGVRGARGRWRGLLQPLQPLLLSWSGRGELGQLSGCEPAGPPLMLKDDALLSAWYLNELLLRLWPRHDPHPPLFAAYEAALVSLPAAPGRALRLFEKRLLDALGWGPAWDHVSDDGRAVSADQSYGFIADRGVVAEGGEVRVSGRTLLALAAEVLDDDLALGEARRVLQAALVQHLGDRPMRTRELLQDWRKLRDIIPASKGENE